MFDFIGNVVKTAANVVTIPVSVAADVVTLGGTLIDRDESYTETNIEKIEKNIDDIFNF